MAVAAEFARIMLKGELDSGELCRGICRVLVVSNVLVVFSGPVSSGPVIFCGPVLSRVITRAAIGPGAPAPVSVMDMASLAAGPDSEESASACACWGRWVVFVTTVVTGADFAVELTLGLKLGPGATAVFAVGPGVCVWVVTGVPGVEGVPTVVPGIAGVPGAPDVVGVAAVSVAGVTPEDFGVGRIAGWLLNFSSGAADFDMTFVDFASIGLGSVLFGAVSVGSVVSGVLVLELVGVTTVVSFAHSGQGTFSEVIVSVTVGVSTLTGVTSLVETETGCVELAKKGWVEWAATEDPKANDRLLGMIIVEKGLLEELSGVHSMHSVDWGIVELWMLFGVSELVLHSVHSVDSELQLEEDSSCIL